MILDPLPKTLEKYGLTVEEFRQLVEAQGGVCAICGKAPASGRLNIDHHHHSGGKWRQWPPERRKKYVRGLLCWTCNRLVVGRGVTLAKVRAACGYLERFASRVAAL